MLFWRVDLLSFTWAHLPLTEGIWGVLQASWLCMEPAKWLVDTQQMTSTFPVQDPFKVALACSLSVGNGDPGGDLKVEGSRPVQFNIQRFRGQLSTQAGLGKNPLVQTHTKSSLGFISWSGPRKGLGEGLGGNPKNLGTAPGFALEKVSPSGTAKPRVPGPALRIRKLRASGVVWSPWGTGQPPRANALDVKRLHGPGSWVRQLWKCWILRPFEGLFLVVAKGFLFFGMRSGTSEHEARQRVASAS